MNKKKTNYKFFLLISIILLLIVAMLLRLFIIEEYKNIDSDKYINISIDDTISLFEDITNNIYYDSIFENDMLRYLKKLHNKYGAKFTLFVFYENDSFNLSECTDLYKDEFLQNSEWLKFGFHGYNNYSNYETNPIMQDYDIVINELKRIVGEESISNIIRIDKFLGNKENVDFLSSNDIHSIDGIYGADTKDRRNYYLNFDQNDELFKTDIYYDNSNNMIFYNSDFRIDNISMFNLVPLLYNYRNDSNLIIFTHEWLYFGTKNKILFRLKLKIICEYGILHGYKFAH